MTRQTLTAPGVVLAGFAACGCAAERATGRPHFGMAATALGVGLVAVVVAGGVERLVARRCGGGVLLAYFAGIGVRAAVAILGAVSLVAFAFESSDRSACLLWVLAAYLAVLVFDTVRAVRAADRAMSANPERGGGPNE